MASIDRTRGLAPIVIPNTAVDGQRITTKAENNKRTERYLLRVTGQVDITAAGGALRNRGSILAALSDIGYIDGGQDKVVCDARLQRFLSEVLAGGNLPATRLQGPGIQVATQLSETVEIFLASARSLNPNETKYVEPNKQLDQQVFVTPVRQISRFASAGAGLVGTITNMSVSVEQVYDDLLGVKPFYTIFGRQISQDVTGVNSQLKVDLKGSRYVRGLAIQQDTDQGEVQDIINALVLRGDAGSVIGDRSVSFTDLVQHMSDEYSGAVQATAGYLFIDFQRYARIASWWNPYQDTNLRLELDVQPSGGGNTGSKVRVFVWEYERTGATDPQPKVVP
jgi:hypothetical protein